MVTRTGIDLHFRYAEIKVSLGQALATNSPLGCWIEMGSIPTPQYNEKTPVQKHWSFFHGDPYGNRTHVTAVKGRCLNRLTNGPGSGNLIRTDDIPGMNRLLYQLSYAAMWSR